MLLVATTACGGASKSETETGQDEGAFFAAIEEELALAAAAELLPSESEMLRVGYLYCEELAALGEDHVGLASIDAIDAVTEKYPEEEPKTVLLVNGPAEQHLCPDHEREQGEP